MAKRRTRKAPQIVPRFLKSAVTVGVIPALVGCEKPQHTQPVVAHYAQPPGSGAERPPPPVVAAYQQQVAPPADADQRPQAPVVAYYAPPPPPTRRIDAGVDAP